MFRYLALRCRGRFGAVIKSTLKTGCLNFYFEGEFYLFAGHSKATGQGVHDILRVSNCQVQKIGSLPSHAAFTVAPAVHKDQIYLCFEYHKTQTCSKSSQPVGPFVDITNSLKQHRYGATAYSKSKCLKIC